ncbi:MAG: hypothetical protein MR902_06130 [Campylobacter sp.]|nr:hypothetical protein [Campylobacter sp.]
MLDIRVFRFDVSKDFLSYYKPYFYDESSNFATLKDLLDDIQENDPYFSFDGVLFVKINGYLCKIDENFGEILAKFGNELKISPLCEKRAFKDLAINSDDFEGIFREFGEFESEREFYISLKPLFYLNDLPKLSGGEFWGESIFVFLEHLLGKFEDQKELILNIARAQIIYHSHTLYFKDYFELEKSVTNLKNALDIEYKNSDKFINSQDILQNFDKNIYKKSFNEFRVCVYDFDENLEKIITKFGAKNIKFSKEDISNLLIENDENTAIKQASRVLFSAFDSGCDFILINDKFIYEFFDKNIIKIQNFAIREFNNFYILNAYEFIELAKGVRVDSLKKHSLKVLI